MNDLNYPQGFYIDKIAEYAKTVIDEADAGRMRCGTTKSLTRMCKFIAVSENVPVTKVYPALRWIGYNSRYHDMKNDEADLLYGLGDRVRRCTLTTRVNVIDVATDNVNLFGNTTLSQYRVQKDVLAIAEKDADHAGIRLRDLNLYNALEGLEVLVSKEPEYILLRDTDLVQLPLKEFLNIKDMVQLKTKMLSTISNF